MDNLSLVLFAVIAVLLTAVFTAALSGANRRVREFEKQLRVTEKQRLGLEVLYNQRSEINLEQAERIGPLIINNSRAEFAKIVLFDILRLKNEVPARWKEEEARISRAMTFATESARELEKRIEKCQLFLIKERCSRDERVNKIKFFLDIAEASTDQSAKD